MTKIRSLGDIQWDVKTDAEPGWHVIIGDNGSGKSTFMRSVALALMGPREAAGLRQDWNTWLNSENSRGTIRLDLTYSEELDRFADRSAMSKKNSVPLAVDIVRDNSGVRVEKSNRVNPNPERHIWGSNSGWFSASFGPFRRFTGGDTEYTSSFAVYPRLAAHLSVFGENFALTECISWLKELQFKKLEQRREGTLLNSIIEFINQDDFLPHHTYLKEITSDRVLFVDGNDDTVPVENLSDGFRSILSLTFELIRQMALAYGSEHVFNSNDPTKIMLPGVVLIDEIDAHLHPSWQRCIGFWFRKHFPRLQFIVTTHTPLVCQAATEGSVFRLARPGSNDRSEMIIGDELNRLLYGNVLDAYGTELFGTGVTRSEESYQKLERLAELNLKELREPLNKEEQEEQRVLRAAMPTSAHTSKRVM